MPFDEVSALQNRKTKTSPHGGMSFVEFVICIASIRAIVALAIDVMVPALGQISTSLGLGASNERQWIITAFMLGFGTAQLLYGIAADRFGRRPVLLTAFALYIICALAAAAAPSFTVLIIARILQGVGAAGVQVVSVSIIRDCYAGRRMAQVNSLCFMVFLSAPIIAPSLGQLILLVAPWPAIFIGLAIYASVMALWVTLRLPETQHRDDRRAIEFPIIKIALHQILLNKVAMSYTVAVTFLLGSWLGFINSAQQIFTNVFHVPTLFPAIFAACSLCMAIAAYLNSRLVQRLGMRKLSHTALCGYLALALIQAALALTGHNDLLSFAILQSLMMFCFGLLVGNCSAIAMEPFGHIAGIAASVQGFISLLGAAVVGAIVGQNFNGTIMPLTIGFGVCSICGLIAVLIAENGSLFKAQNRDQVSA